jgi:hypothetical protein
MPKNLLKDFSCVNEPLGHPVGLDLHSDRVVRPLGFPNGSMTHQKNPEKLRCTRARIPVPGFFLGICNPMAAIRNISVLAPDSGFWNRNMQPILTS